jgi:Ser/Thr protein kinase RdoA (MazF antagonist)
VSIPAEVRAAYGLPESAGDPASELGARHIPSLINLTFVVNRTSEPSSEPIIVQRLHPVFGEKVHLDIEAVTAHLARRGLETPRLIRTLDGRLWVNEPPPSARVWRALSFVDGQTFHRTEDGAQLGSAARLIARFHGALADLDHDFVHVRPIHDTVRHLDNLRAVLASERSRNDAPARELGDEILRQAADIRIDYGEFPERVIHGDPKLSNVMFDPRDPRDARCMIDLDTLGRGYLAHELGDALRSWCNPAGEDSAAPSVNQATFRAVLDGYGSERPAGVQPEEVLSAIDGLETISLELASRFAADAILDDYFGWDPTRFGSRREHNLVRARGQLALSRSVRQQRSELRRVGSEALRRAQ